MLLTLLTYHFRIRGKMENKPKSSVLIRKSHDYILKQGSFLSPPLSLPLSIYKQLPKTKMNFSISSY